MTGRTADEWIGKKPDEPCPPRVRLRRFDEAKGRCTICTRKINAGERWICDHIVALTNGGQNRERNLQIICDWCDRKIKTPADVAEKALVYRKRAAHLGIKSNKRPMPGSKLSGLRKHMDGTVSRRNP